MREEFDDILDLKVAAIAAVWPYDKHDPKTELLDRAICVMPASERDPRELADYLAGLVCQVDDGLAESLKEVLNILNQKRESRYV